jgi:hypothetical protein
MGLSPRCRRMAGLTGKRAMAHPNFAAWDWKTSEEAQKCQAMTLVLRQGIEPRMAPWYMPNSTISQRQQTNILLISVLLTQHHQPFTNTLVRICLAYLYEPFLLLHLFRGLQHWCN